METAISVPLTEYLTTHYRPDAEWIDGELRPRNAGTGTHSCLMTSLIRLLHPYEERSGILVLCTCRIKISPTRYRVPDVLALHPNAPFEQVPTIPPLLCAEVLSEEDLVMDIQDKIDDYLNMGIQAIWIINPRARKTYQIQSGGMMPQTTLTVPGTPISVTAPEIFAELDRLQQRDEQQNSKLKNSKL